MKSEKEFWSRMNKSAPNGCWIWTGAKRDKKKGYGEVLYQGARWATHRLAAHLSGKKIDGLVVMHKCDTPPCCNPDHLSVGTHIENMADRQAKGRTKHGKAHYLAKLNEDAVRHIRKGEMTMAEYAKHYKVDRKTIWEVQKGKGWKLVK